MSSVDASTVLRSRAPARLGLLGRGVRLSDRDGVRHAAKSALRPLPNRDDLSAFMITVIYAIFAGGTIVTLLRDPSIAPRIGRRGMMLGAVGMMMVAAGVLAAWKDLPGLLIGRLLTGVSVGLAAGTAITYLIELRLRADPKASVVRARTIGTSVNVGALGVGPLIAGCLAEWVSYR